MANDQHIESLWRGAARGQRRVGGDKTDRLIAERRQNLLIPQQSRLIMGNISTVSPHPTGRTGSSTSSAGVTVVRQGNQTSKRLPSPGVLCTFIAPPCLRTIWCTVASPRPFPVGRVVKKGSKIRARVSLSMPRPPT